MKARQGFALVLVLCITSILSLFLLQAYRRTSLLLRTVVEREKTVMSRSKTEALLQYALYMAKHNWNFLIKQAKKGGQEQFFFDWEAGDEKVANATCSYTWSGKNQLRVEAVLQQDNVVFKLSCQMSTSPEGKCIINEWKEGS